MPVRNFSVTVTGFDLERHAVRNTGRGANIEKFGVLPREGKNHKGLSSADNCKTMQRGSRLFAKSSMGVLKITKKIFNAFDISHLHII